MPTAFTRTAGATALGTAVLWLAAAAVNWWASDLYATWTQERYVVLTMFAGLAAVGTVVVLAGYLAARRVDNPLADPTVTAIEHPSSPARPAVEPRNGTMINRGETPLERLDRNWADLLQELRVTQPACNANHRNPDQKRLLCNDSSARGMRFAGQGWSGTDDAPQG